jgi:hypothetical protein
MSVTKPNPTIDLVDRLGSALAGTHGRDVSLTSLKSLVQMEVAEWNADRQQTAHTSDDELGFQGVKSQLKS